MNTDDLALLLWHAEPHLDLDTCAGILEALSALGYSLVASDAPGEYVGNGSWQPVAKEINRRFSSIHFRDALLAFAALDHTMHLCIKKPTQLEITT